MLMTSGNLAPGRTLDGMDTRSLGIAVMAISLLPFGTGLQLVLERRAFLARATSAQALVVEVEQVEGRNEDRGPIMYPILQWLDTQGQTQRGRSNIGAFPTPQDIGDHVDVRYDSHDPTDVRIDSRFSLWFEPLLYLIPAALTMIGGWVIFRRKPRKPRPASS